MGFMATETPTFRPIRSDAQWGPPSQRDPDDDFHAHFSEVDKDEIRRLLVGRRVVQVVRPGDAPGWGGHRAANAGHLLLDDGTVLKLFGNEGGCCCAAGDYELTHLEGVDNVITDVTFQDSPDGEDLDAAGEGAYRIFVFADSQQINLATFEGSDGNGYYGTGYHVLVRRSEGDDGGT